MCPSGAIEFTGSIGCGKELDFEIYRFPARCESGISHFALSVLRGSFPIVTARYLPISPMLAGANIFSVFLLTRFANKRTLGFTQLV